jgi:tetratricopeptide (TPR) repeat protein
MIYSEKEYYRKIIAAIEQQFNDKPARIFWIISLFIGIIMISIHQDYSITNDEPIHQAHGEVVWDYFSKNDNLALASPIDSTGNLVQTFSTEKNHNFRGMNFFGGFFDLIVNALYNKLNISDLYNFRHLLNGLFGWLIFVFIGLTVKEIAGWRVAILALFFGVLSPRLFGHAFANPKDIPFAALFIIGIQQIIVLVKNLPKVKLINAIALILVIGISISIRVSGLLLIGYIGLAVSTWWIISYITTKSINILSLLTNFLGVGVIIIAGYLSVMIYWPYASTDWLAPIKVLIQVSDFNVFNAYELFQGKWYNRWEIPINYIPVWIWISVPVFINLGIIMIGFVYHKKIRENINLIIYSLLIFYTIFPILFIIGKGSNIYNGIRHLLFIFPPLIALTTIAWNQFILAWKNSIFKYTIILILSISMFQPLIWSIKAHPYQAMYFSPLTGGNIAIFGNYETDYWGISTKEAVEWIAENTKEERKTQQIGIKMFYGDRLKVENYSKNYKNLIYVPGNSETGWDYEIVYLSAAKFNNNILYQWPPINTVYEIKAAGLPLAAVVKNKFAGLNLEQIANKYPNETNFIQLSLEYYAKGDFVNAYLSSKKAFDLNNNNYLALNNMGAAANAMQLYDIAYNDIWKCIEIKPDFVLAINNLKVSADGKLLKKDKAQLTNLSVRAYLIGKYKESADYSKEILKANPKDAISWNNLGSALNAMQNYEEAKVACEKAIEIEPNFQLAKNNLNYSLTMLKRN